MNSKKPKNKLVLEIDAFETVVCKDKEMQSFLNVFHFKEDNLNKSHLGELFGVIQVFEYSQQNAYLPNLVSQVLKKEFYASSKRTAEEAFEAALKKANIALSDLTRHEVASWIGKLHAVIGVVQNDNFYFTQAGGGKILLIRDKKVSDVSRGLDREKSDHPMKTFSDVSSGKLMLDDKVLFATESFFETFSWEDIKRHANAFNSSEFDNLVKSTLELEGTNVGISIVNIKEKIITAIASLPRSKQKHEDNFFGNQKIADNKPSSKPDPKIEYLQQQKKESAQKKQEFLEAKKNMSPFEKDPELYIKEGDSIDVEENLQDSVFEKLKGAINKKKINIKTGGKQDNSLFEQENENKNNGPNGKKSLDQNLTNQKPLKTSETNLEAEKQGAQSESGGKVPFGKVGQKPKKVFSTIKNAGDEKKIDEKNSKAKQPEEKKIEEAQLSTALEEKNKHTRDQNISDFFAKQPIEKRQAEASKPNIANIVNSQQKKIVIKGEHTDASADNENIFFKLKRGISFITSQYASEFEILKQKKSESKLTFFDILRSTYIFSTAISILILLLLVFFFLRDGQQAYLEIKEDSPQENSTPEKSGDFIPEEEVSVVSLGSADSNITAIANYRNDVFLFTENNSFYHYDSNLNEFGGLPASDQLRDVVTMVEMPVLNLIFFITKDAVYSYSPVLERFDRHNIKFPDNIDVIDAGVHKSFSFLYVFDRNSGQVYRYPRTEGGFGSSINWFQQPISAENAVAFAIDDGIRVSYADGTIEQYYQKKLKSTFLIDSEPKVVPKKIVTDNEKNHYYILDSENPRILKINKNNNEIADQYWNKSFKDAKHLAIHEEREAYVVSADNKLLQFKLQ